MSRLLGVCLIGLTMVTLPVEDCFAQSLPPVSGQTFTLSTSPNHKLFIPSDFDLTSGGVDVLVHFHGDPATVNNNAGYADLNAVVVNVTYSGFSSAYSTPFSNPSLFGNVMDAALSTLRAQPGFGASVEWDDLAISSFSAGYGAVREILKQPSYYDQIDGLLMADSIYASFTSSSDHTPLDSQMVNFRRFALDAANGHKSMTVTHSQIPTYTYSNTAETADDLMQHVGVSPTATNESGLGTLQFYRKANVGNFNVWGATGSVASSHTQHLQYLAQWLADMPFDDEPPPVGGEIIPFVDFEVDEGTFHYDPTLSGTNEGIITATADRVTVTAHKGFASQRIDVEGDANGWTLRHTSGFGEPSLNTPIAGDGWIGFWLKTDAPGVSVQIALDDPLSADRGLTKPVIADGQWHLYQWDMDDASQWESWAFGDGTITGPTVTLDSIFFYGEGDATIYMDDVAYNNTASLIPAPVTGDINGDGFVGVDDLNYLLTHWNHSVTKGSVEEGDLAGIGDGFIGVDDLNVVLLNWNSGTPPGTPPGSSAIIANSLAIPEPSALGVFGFFVVHFIYRRTSERGQP